MNIELREDKFHVRTFLAPCVCRCKFCCLGKFPKNARISFDDYEEVLKKFKDIGQTHNMRLRSFIYNCVEHDYLDRQIKLYDSLQMEKNEYLQIDLNGTRIKRTSEIKEWLNYLQECGVKKVAFSWFGLERKHDEFVGINGYFNYLIECMKEAKKKKIYVVSKVFLYKEILNEVDKLINLIEKYSDTIICALMEYSGNAKIMTDQFINEKDYNNISENTKKHISKDYINKFKSEKRWINEIITNKKSLFKIVDYVLYIDVNNIKQIKKKSVDEIINNFRKMDKDFQHSFESVEYLANNYGDKECDILYEYRDIVRKWLDKHFEKNHLDKEMLFGFTKNSVEWKVYERL